VGHEHKGLFVEGILAIEINTIDDESYFLDEMTKISLGTITISAIRYSLSKEEMKGQKYIADNF
jgi:hypothetical protein